MCDLGQYISRDDENGSTIIFKQRDFFLNLIYFQISVNLFRTLPPPNSSNGTEFKPKNKLFRYQDMSQLQLVYKIFQKFLEFPNFKISIAQPFINQQFVLQLLELFNSAFPFEREYLKMILHCIYKKCLDLRTFIRREITFIFYR